LFLPSDLTAALPSEADFGMFSLFSRTGAPTKMGPHKKTGTFRKLEKSTFEFHC